MLENFSTIMKRDWDQRARENAKWFINTLSVEQSEEDFDTSGLRDVEMMVLSHLELMSDRRDPKSLRVLEIGCGIGRMTRHLAEIFGEIHAVDVSGEMVQQGRERLRSMPHVFFHETNGNDFSQFPDDYFDVILSFWVFQHMPDVNIILANIRDGFRVLKPGGGFLFQCNGTSNREYQEQEKNTWSGATFAESDIRKISREIGSQLVVVANNNTLYCWAMLRKQFEQSVKSIITDPKILTFSGPDNIQQEEIPTREGDVVLRLLINGLDRNSVDANNVFVQLGERSLSPFYVGTLAHEIAAETIHELEAKHGDLIQIKCSLPPEIPAGETRLNVYGASGWQTNSIQLTLPSACAAKPIIHQICNAEDSGTDIYTNGPKSLIQIYVMGLAENTSVEDAEVRINDIRLPVQSVSFLPSLATWSFFVQLPPDTMPGQSEFKLQLRELSSIPMSATIRSSSPT